MKQLLAGPILRRVTPNRVCVWFATTQPIDLRLQVMSKAGEVLGESIELTKTDYCQLGQNLFVYLLQARCYPEKPYPVDTFLYYQLLDDQKQPLDLSKLSYDSSSPHPKFFIARELKQLLHGSCRKPHGGGNSPDALSYGDAVLQTTHDNLAERPALLLLTGDQIYADDVSIAVLAMLKAQAAAFGLSESVPCHNKAGQAITDVQQLPLHERKELLEINKSGFTSGESENHLLSFGEFAAMYIYVFGNAANWQPPQLWTQVQPLVDASVTKKAEKAFTEQQTAVKTFHKTLPNVRKLLANIPTYMIFDDHDVTDDWNITNGWYDDVRDSVLGKRIVANALSAYWAFQGWGNDPDNFDKDLHLTISQYLLDNNNDVEISERYDLHTWKHRGWGFSVSTNPPIIAIDSRTQREPTTNSYLPILLDRYARDWLRVEWAKLKTDPSITISATTCPVFIATTPALGFSIVERLQKIVYWIAELLESYQCVRNLERLLGKKDFLTKKMIDLMDMEAWTSNEQSFLSLMNCLSQDMKIQQCVFLSGDVHYSFSSIGLYVSKQGAKNLYCYQLVSSSLKNSPEGKQKQEIEVAGGFGDGVTLHTSLWKILFPWLPIDSWRNWVHLLPHKSSKTRVCAECNLGLVNFEGGKPVQHTLLANEQIVYELPDCTTFKFSK